MPQAPSILLNIRLRSGDDVAVGVEVSRSVNFGFAGREKEGALAHVAELRELGLPAPTRIPSIFPIPPSRITTDSEVCVPGEDSYGEVEFALLCTEKLGWVVCAAADHSDFLVEGLSTTRAKTVYDDVLSTDAWLLDDVLENWDSITMTCERRDGAVWELIQSGSVGELMRPHDLIKELEDRSGRSAAPGTVILSGTIGGEIRPGGDGWRCTLRSPDFPLPLVAEYDVAALPAEI